MASSTQQQQQQPTEQEIVDGFNQLRQMQNNIMNSIAKNEGDRHEHLLVLETLKPLEPHRKCHRLVGGVLIERPANEVVPQIEEAMRNFDHVLATLGEQLKKNEHEITEYMKTHNISMKNNTANVAQQQQHPEGQARSTGVLA